MKRREEARFGLNSPLIDGRYGLILGEAILATFRAHVSTRLKFPRSPPAGVVSSFG